MNSPVIQPMLEDVQSPEKAAMTAKPGITWHVITCEYPPQSGGVSDYTYLLAKGMAVRGDQVHIWCPAGSANAPEIPGVEVHPQLGRLSPADLRRAGTELDRFPNTRRLLVQWVPHGFGYKSLNLPFCLWLWYRSAFGRDRIDLMVHEPFLPFERGRWRQNAAAAVHRLMTVILLRTADRVWVSTPTWEKLLRAYEWGRHHKYTWLPLPSNVPRVNDSAGANAIREKYGQGPVLGHFGTFGPLIKPLLASIIPALLRKAPDASLVLIGGGSKAFRDNLVKECRDLEDRVYAIGHIDARDPQLSLHLSACDLLIQPYPDGVTSRRTTVMAALSHGRPAVTTAGELTESFWESSDAVVLAPAGDSAAFVESTLRLLRNPEERASIGKSAMEFYKRNFEIEQIVELLHRPD